MRTLVIDTTTDLRLSLLEDDPVTGRAKCLAQTQETQPRRQVEALVPCLEQLIAKALGAKNLAQAHLTQIVCFKGPGLYTGLRVGIMAARMLAKGLGIPVYGVSLLETIAWEYLKRQTVNHDQVVTVITYARRSQVYCGGYSKNLEEVISPRAIKIEDLPRSFKGFGQVQLLFYPPDKLEDQYEWCDKNLAEYFANDGEYKDDQCVPIYNLEKVEHSLAVASAQLVQHYLDQRSLRKLEPLPLYLREPDVQT